MAEIVTDRDLYLAVLRLIDEQSENTRLLEDYLQALSHLPFSRACFLRQALTPDEFFALLAEAFVAAPRRVPDGYIHTNAADIYEYDLAEQPGFAGWEIRITRQIIDLREMAESGQLADKMRHFGIASPRGSRWCNFDPCGFLECATAGEFGGRNWEDEPDREPTSLGDISWERFRDFLRAGQEYE
jgi:hypothetical protein